MSERLQKLRSKFLEIYGDSGGKLAFGRAPGRANLIGEHTDYNQGYVLPTAINRDILVAAQRRSDRALSVYSMDFSERITAPLALLKLRPEDGWANYVKSVLWSLENAGHKLDGFNLVISGDVPQGAGLASSAALELAVLAALTPLGDWAWEPAAMAKLCQRAESQFMGVPCGLMDQMVSAAGRPGEALFMDCRSLETQSLPLALGGARFVLVNSGVTRGLNGSAYSERREECRQALKALQARNPKYEALRDVGVVAFERHKSALTPRLRARAEHVVYENDRVLKAKEALKAGDAAAFGALMLKSHRSLQRLFEVSCPELDQLVDLAQAIPGVHGARMTGAGFGGCTLNLVEEAALASFKDQMAREYRKKVGLNPVFIPVEPAAPAGEVAV
jgi:galactokinase